MSYSAEVEGLNTRQRQAKGIIIAKEKGIKFGQPKKELPENFDELYKRYLKGEAIYSLAKECNSISESTLRNRLRDKQLGKF